MEGKEGKEGEGRKGRKGRGEGKEGRNVKQPILSVHQPLYIPNNFKQERDDRVGVNSNALRHALF